MLKIALWFQPATRHEHICYAHACRLSESCSNIEIIIFFQERTVNDVENVALMFIPVFRCQFACDGFKLLIEIGSILIILDLQSVMHNINILIVYLPKIRAARAFPAARV